MSEKGQNSDMTGVEVRYDLCTGTFLPVGHPTPCRVPYRQRVPAGSGRVLVMYVQFAFTEEFGRLSQNSQYRGLSTR